MFMDAGIGVKSYSVQDFKIILNMTTKTKYDINTCLKNFNR